MPNPESAPAFQQSKVVEKKGTKERFATILTHLPGVSLRTEPGFEVDILKKTVEQLYGLAKGFVKRKFQIDELTVEQRQPDQEIKNLAKTHEGLRGIRSEPDNFVLSVLPRDSVTYDPQLLKESLGIAYSSVVHEDLVVAISAPVGFQTERGPLREELLDRVLTQALLDLGLTQENLDKIMSKKTVQRVDEKTLEKMIEDGKVTLLEGTKQIDRTWAITVAPLRKSPES